MRLIASDLDRTLIPNGRQKYDEGTMNVFCELLERNKVGIVFVTGRYKEILLKGMRRYGLPKPEYIIANVGTTIFHYKKGRLVELKEWRRVLTRDWKNFRRGDVAKLLRDIPGLREQEKINLNEFKQSYYLSSKVKGEEIVAKVWERLSAKGIGASVVHSVDANRKVGMLDVMPEHGNKEAALDFVLKKLKVRKSNVLFSGDSGNDLLALTAGFHGVLVKNALPSVKKEFFKIARRKGILKKCYVARGGFLEPRSGKKLNGNYVSGVIEGAYYFGFFKD
jgi:HAD superfamily hydrolase (TIGR01484 family)